MERPALLCPACTTAQFAAGKRDWSIDALIASQALGLPVLNGWGLTETSHVLACRRNLPGLNVRGSVGESVRDSPFDINYSLVGALPARDTDCRSCLDPEYTMLALSRTLSRARQGDRHCVGSAHGWLPC